MLGTSTGVKRHTEVKINVIINALKVIYLKRKTMRVVRSGKE